MSVLTDKFKNITGYNIENFFNDYILFTEKHYQNIVNYYNGYDIVGDSFDFFDSLSKESIKIESLLQMYSNSFSTVDFWNLIDKFDDIKIKLDTINNLSKWLRSSRIDRYSSNVNISYVQKQGETLEKIVSKSGSVNSENEWVNVALENDLPEEGYSFSGGALLTLKLLNNLNFDIKNIVDSLSENNLYGKDYKNKIEFVDGDIDSISGEEALMQTIENIFVTEKGSIPEFPNDGLDPNLIGSNVNIFNYPVQIRNIMSMLQKNDIFKDLKLLDIKRIEDSIYLSFQISTKIGDIIKKDLKI